MKILKEKCFLPALLLCSFLTMIYFGIQKEGYHVDEVYSYGLANSEYLPFMHFGESGYSVKDWMMDYGAGESLGDLFRNLWKDYQILRECDFQWRESVIYRDYLVAQANSADTRTTTWMSGQDYQDYIAVSKTNTFNYASVYYNQRGDVHPPLYYMLLHTVCSIFQGRFSKWFGLGINIVILLLTQIVLYKMVETYLGGRTTAMATVAAYGLSCGVISTAVFLRMYALLTFLIVACCAVHLKIFAEDFCLKGRNAFLLMLTVLSGYMTHYYFVLYAIGMAAVFVVLLAVRKRWRTIIQYIMLLAVTAAVGLVIWPFAIKHVFQGYRGNAAINILVHREFYLIKVKVMIYRIAEQMLHGNSWILWLMFAALLGLMVWKRGRGLPIGKGAVAVLPAAFYFVVTAQIVPELIDRYVMCMYPFLCLFIVVGAALLIRSCLRESWFHRSVTVVGILFLLLNNVYLHTPNYLISGGQQTVVLSSNTDCVYVLPDDDWNESAVDSTILAQCRRVAVVYESSLEVLQDTYQYQLGDLVMVAIQQDMDIETVLGEVRAVLGIENLPEIGRLDGSIAVRIFLADGAFIKDTNFSQ